MFFFFQAEDGIRDLVRSRGLGDVYKRQGIGGAITDASAEVFAKLSGDKQQEFLNAYFNKEKGIGYSLARTTIHSCDFSSGSYTYVTEGDKELKSFSIQHDKQFKIPLIKKAIETAGGKLLLYASPWSLSLIHI